MCSLQYFPTRHDVFIIFSCSTIPEKKWKINKSKTYNPVTQRWLLSTEYFLSVSYLCLNILWKYGFSGLMTCLHINVLWFMGPSPWWRTACWSFLYCLLMFPCWIVNAFNLFSHFGGKDDPGIQKLPSLLMERIGNKKSS